MGKVEREIPEPIELCNEKQKEINVYLKLICVTCPLIPSCLA